MRPSAKLRPAVTMIGASLVVIAQAAKGASDVDRAALEYAVAAYDHAARWTRDTTETSRRHAFGAASAARAVAEAPTLRPATMQGVRVRRSLAAFATAILALTEGRTIDAMTTADQAASMAPAMEAA